MKWLLSTRNVASATEKLNFWFYLYVVNLNLNSHMLLMFTIGQHRYRRLNKGWYFTKKKKEEKDV